MPLSVSSEFARGLLCEPVDFDEGTLGTYRVISTQSTEVENTVSKVRKYLEGKIKPSIFSHLSPEDQLNKDLSEMHFSQPLEKVPSYMKKPVQDFISYLNETKNFLFEINGFDYKELKYTCKIIPYIHRWTEPYKKSILAKLYQLESVLGNDISECIMITLTTYQKGLTYEAALKKLMESYKLLQKTLFKINGTVDFFYVLEPHKTGYAHMHLLYMKCLNDHEKERITDLWANKYHAGSKRHGIHFSEPRKSSDGTFESGSIGKLRSYLMKYLSKSIYHESWSPAELVFNATLWKTGVRLWNCSRNFSKIMAKPTKEKNPNWKCISVNKLDESRPGEKFPIWDREHGMRSDKKTIFRFANSGSIKPDPEKLKQKNRICIPKCVVDSKGKPYTSYYVYEKKDVPVESIEDSDIDAVPEGLLSNKALQYPRKEIRKLYRNVLSII